MLNVGGIGCIKCLVLHGQIGKEKEIRLNYLFHHEERK